PALPLHPGVHMWPLHIYILATMTVYTAQAGVLPPRSMNMQRFLLTFVIAAAALALAVMAQQTPAAGPYKVQNVTKVGGAGGFDYVYADSDGRRLYIPRTGQGARVTVFDLDSFMPVGEISNTNARGAAVSTKSGHAFGSSKPVAMWDS